VVDARSVNIESDCYAKDVAVCRSAERSFTLWGVHCETLRPLFFLLVFKVCPVGAVPSAAVAAHIGDTFLQAGVVSNGCGGSVKDGIRCLKYEEFGGGLYIFLVHIAVCV